MALTIVKPENIAEYIGKDLGTTEWFNVDQDRINKFAEATEDHQFIHVDPEKATPIFGSTIAHGFLSLALTAGIGQDIALVVEGAKMGLNYGLDKVRFLSPVPVNSRIRMNSVVMDITEKNPGQFLVKSAVTMEIEGLEKPAFIAETLSMWVL
ncbi:MAG: dehydratase [SAR86 cluster bacterium BACL1 MAG-120828-bin5]|jgi:acyl dehydratase|nr:MAG: dehydratase [SAR86 cluster bacterium BACL1 MAG-120828-bin5]KRP01139.1 MAG: dehydratase [SAR86 cluster bacterium BACL1 MAG-120924-bin88]KRP15267.1 MAG: dehydratase [SAR86 cluster bacterium BACL1 MAG-121001-bin56]